MIRGQGLSIVGVIVVGFAFAGNAAAQVSYGACPLEYTATLNPPISLNATTAEVQVTGTFDCGVVSGTICGVGTVTGTCESSTNATHTVTCDGTCGFDEETGAPVCPGTVLAEGDITGECTAGVCVAEGDVETDGGPGRSGTVAVTTPETYLASVTACSTGGITSADFVGVGRTLPRVP